MAMQELASFAYCFDPQLGSHRALHFRPRDVPVSAVGPYHGSERCSLASWRGDDPLAASLPLPGSAKDENVVVKESNGPTTRRGYFSSSRLVSSPNGRARPFSWNKRLSRHSKAGEYERTLDLFHEMESKGLKFNAYSFVPVINACASLQFLEEGRRIHTLIRQIGCESDVYVGSCLVDMYAKCGSIIEAQIVFEEMPRRDVVSWTAMIRGFVKSGEGQKALDLTQEMQATGLDPDPITLVSVLNACASVAALELGRSYHKQIIQKGYESDIYLNNSLIIMYAKCGSIEDARTVFNKMEARNVSSWNSMIFAYAKCRQGQEALKLYQEMQRERMNADPATFVAVLNACASLGALQEGRHVHEQILRRGYESLIIVSNSLIDMYCKCGSIENAWIVCNKMPLHDQITWKTLITAYVKDGQEKKALEVYRRMHSECVDMDPVTFVVVLNACASVGALQEGRRIHEQIIQSGCESNVFVGNSLIDMYAKCGDIQDAWRVFSKMPTRDVISWTAMILGYVKCGRGHDALELSDQMQSDGVDADSVTFVAMLNACSSVGALDKGRCVHEQIIQRGLESDVFIGSSLVDMYAKCGSIKDAWDVFNTMPTRNVVSWNAMLLGYVRCGEAQQALELYGQMQEQGVDPDPVTFVQVVNACGNVGTLEEGRRVHEEIRRRDCESDILLGCSLLDMYAKCGSMEDAWKVFNDMPARNVVCWTLMILAYLKCGEGQKAFELSQDMERQGVDLDPFAFVAVLKVCATRGALEEGRIYHKQVIARGYETNIFVGNSLIHMYAKCRSIEDAWSVFDKMPTRDVVSWNSMILGYVKDGKGQKALELSQKMYEDGVELDRITFIGLLNACAGVGRLDVGRSIHDQIIQGGRESDLFVGCSLVDMYAKCGSIDDARRVFDKMPVRNVVAWNAMIYGYVKCAEDQRALELYREMHMDRVDPDPLTFVWLLKACATLRALEEGRKLHEQIILKGYDSDTSVGARLAEMYAACGNNDKIGLQI